MSIYFWIRLYEHLRTPEIPLNGPGETAERSPRLNFQTNMDKKSVKCSENN